MTHYIQTNFSTKTICDRDTFSLLQSPDSSTIVIQFVDCPECLEKLKKLVNSLGKNNNDL